MRSFTSPLHVSILDEFRKGRVLAELLVGFSYDVGHLGSGETITVPPGFVSDFASIPRAFWWFEPPLGRSGKAAIVHDWMYATDCGYTRAQADAIFYEALGVLGVATWKRALIYAAVRIGGGPGWSAARKAASDAAHQR